MNNKKIMRTILLITAVAFTIIGCKKKPVPSNIETGETGKVWVSFSFVDRDFFKKYASYDLFIEDEKDREISFTTDVPAKDFSWLAISFSDEGYDKGYTYKIDRELYTLKELNPQKPFVVTWQEIGIFAHRGFSYRDENGQKQYYALHEGNYGGDPEEYDGPDLVVEQFFPMRILIGKYEYSPNEPVVLLYLEEDSYTLHIGDAFYEGTAVIDYGDVGAEESHWYVTLEGIKWAHNWVRAFDGGSLDNLDWDDIDWDKLPDEETYDVFLWMEEYEEGIELVFQNHGEHFAPYIIFSEIHDKFVSLKKAP